MLPGSEGSECECECECECESECGCESECECGCECECECVWNKNIAVCQPETPVTGVYALHPAP